MQSKEQSGNKARVKILIADCEGVYRLGLKKLFSVEDDLRVVAQAENAQQLVAMSKSFRPDLAIVQWEIALDGYHNLLSQVLSESPGCKIIVTGSRLADGDRERLFRHGASGMIPRSAKPEVFVQSVRKVMQGEIINPLEQESHEKQEIGSVSSHRPRPVDTLTRRERTVISCLAQGWHNREIAQHLTINEQTVKNHLRSIYDKVGVSDRLELVLYAIHQRLELPPVNLSC